MKRLAVLLVLAVCLAFVGDAGAAGLRGPALARLRGVERFRFRGIPSVRVFAPGVNVHVGGLGLHNSFALRAPLFNRGLVFNRGFAFAADPLLIHRSLAFNRGFAFAPAVGYHANYGLNRAAFAFAAADACPVVPTVPTVPAMAVAPAVTEQQQTTTTSSFSFRSVGP